MASERKYIEHKLIWPKSIEARDYQINIAKTAGEKNTLVCIPTGIGKTICAILVVANRLKKYPFSQILVVAPTRPLCAQHEREFKKHLKIPPSEIVLVTGQIAPERRKKLYEKSTVIVATPQTIQNDLVARRLNLENFSLLVVDEVHRAVKRYAYPLVARFYLMQAECPRILGLTASPGASRQRVQEIRQNLAIQAVEVRDERSEDVRDYVQKTQLDVIRVDFPPEFKLIHENLRDAFNKRVSRLRSFGLTPKSVTKKMLLRLQKKLAREGKGGFRFAAMSIVAQAIRIEHALELLETQGIRPLHNYFKNLQTRATQERKRSLSAVVADPAVQEAIKLTTRLHKEGYEHPKLFVLKQIIARFFSKNSRAKIMVFAHFRTSISRIVEELAGMSGIRPIHFVGQSHKTDSEGLKQQEQIRILDKFRALEYNTLVCSSVGEEGLDIPEVDLVVFYDAVPSEIRAIQRRGRTGRAKPGHVIILLTKGTRDESYLWVSRYKEKKMRRALQNMDARQKSLMEFK